MSWTLLGWILIAASIATSMLVFPLRSRGTRGNRPELETCKADLEEISARVRLGTLSEAQADAARLALLSQSRSSSPIFGQDLRGVARVLTAPAAVFLLVAGFGAAAVFFNAASLKGKSESAQSDSQPASGADAEMLAQLNDYSRSVAAESPKSQQPASTADGKLLPDVNTMIEQLAARLESAPGDIKGWRMLGWSYLNTARYDQAATAFAKAVQLDPSSTELKQLYDEAKAKAATANNVETVADSQARSVGMAGDGASSGDTPSTEAASPQERDAQIRSMVDRLADRLEKSPRDVEGWTRLLRSRVVLGEKKVAATTLRKALEVFKDDSAASEKITAAALELGLKAE